MGVPRAIRTPGVRRERVAPRTTPELDATSAQLIQQHGFAFLDFDTTQDYGTTENILRTYGFIFGPRAIAHLKATGQTTIRWRFRIHFRHT